MTYRSRYMAKPEWLPVLDLLIRDDSNPRSIAFQLRGLNDYVQRIGRRITSYNVCYTKLLRARPPDRARRGERARLDGDRRAAR